jgi:DUF4097 and DUF4098 domain-containing protein YvlB
MRSNYPQRPVRPKPDAVCWTLAVLVFMMSIGWPIAASADNAAREEVFRAIERTITISGSPQLQLDLRSAGDLRIRTHARPEVRVDASMRASAPSREIATEFINAIRVEVVETPSRVTIRTTHPEWNRRNRDVGFAIDFDIVMPEAMTIDARHRHGNMSVTGLKAEATLINEHGRLSVTDGRGRYRLENSFGAIEAARLDGDVIITGSNGGVLATTMAGSLTLTNRFGAVDFRDVGAISVTSSNGDVRGANVNGSATLKGAFGRMDVRNVSAKATVDNSNGDVVVQDVRGGAEVSNRFGRVEAQNVTGDLRVNASNGDVRIADVEGATSLTTRFGGVQADRIRGSLRVDNGNGDVRVSAISGPANVTSTFGAVILRDVEGRIDVRNGNGALDVWPAAKPGACHDIALTSSFSRMRVYLPDTGYTLTARATFGKIRTDVPVTATGVIGTNSLSGTIGRGGCLLQLTNNNGDLEILRAGSGTSVSAAPEPIRQPPRAPRPPRPPRQ